MLFWKHMSMKGILQKSKNSLKPGNGGSTNDNILLQDEFGQTPSVFPVHLLYP